VLARNHAVLVDSLGGAPDHRLEILLEVGRLEVGIELGGEVVTQVLGVLGIVVAADSPRVLVFGEVAGDELDGIERVGFAGLARCKDSAVDGLLRDLPIR
jgi:hypothetical protein